MNSPKKRLAALVALLALMLSLAACTSAEVDPIEEALGYSKDTVFLTVDDEPITAEYYLPWLYNNVTYINSMYQMMGSPGVDFNEEVEDGQTAGDFLKEQAAETTKLFWVIEDMAAEAGIVLTEEDETRLADERAAAVEALGTEDEYLKQLYASCLTPEMMDHISAISVLTTALEDSLCGPGKEYEATGEIVRDYAESLGVFKAKHILLLTSDPAVDGAEYTEAEVAAQRALAEDILAQIQSAADPLATFDELMMQHSEDSGLPTNPDGYLFSTQPDGVEFTSRMVPEFENGTMALGYNEISGIIESEYGYHIILRLDPTEDPLFLTDYEGRWYGFQMDTLYQERMLAMEEVRTEAFTNFDVAAFFEDITAYQATLMPQEAETPDLEVIPQEETPAEGEADAPATDETEEPAPEATPEAEEPAA